MLVDVKDAAERAVSSLKDLVPEAENISFEEFEIVEGPDGKERADITLSFDRKGEEPVYFNSMTDKLTEQITGRAVGPRRPRHFRILTIREDGRPVGMKIRKRS